ncbi:hypothetical protein ACE1OC_40745 [Streptomyces sp. DSM 116496]|uniref:hypothetical protein n=1 Tax=Streptomyces stoeckheimensis TaxID=3344656 RepID=UPI0038B2C1B9
MDVKADWVNKMRTHADSSGYARQSGNPVVCTGDCGVNDNQRPFTPDASLEILNWFKQQGCYVIDGVLTCPTTPNGGRPQ